jgi:hypothetical protein
LEFQKAIRKILLPIPNHPTHVEQTITEDSVDVDGDNQKSSPCPVWVVIQGVGPDASPVLVSPIVNPDLRKTLSPRR